MSGMSRAAHGRAVRAEAALSRPAATVETAHAENTLRRSPAKRIFTSSLMPARDLRNRDIIDLPNNQPRGTRMRRAVIVGCLLVIGGCQSGPGTDTATLSMSKPLLASREQSQLVV